MLQRLARNCVRHRWIVIGVWVAIIVVINGIASSVGPDWRTDFVLPSGEARDVQDLLEENNPERAGFSASIVIQAEQGVDDPAVRQRLEDLMAFVPEADAPDCSGIDDPGDLEDCEAEREAALNDDETIEVTSPYDAPDQISQREGSAGQIAYAQLDVSDRPFEDLADIGDRIRDYGDELNEADPIDGLVVEYGGDLFGEFELPEAEIYGILAAVIILIIAFGSVLAMGLPIGIALFGLGCASAIVAVLSNSLSMPDFTTAMVAMIGLGVGIDYALFIVTRYREALHAGLGVEDCVVEAIDTSGRAVIFAGMTVVIALLGLTIMGLPFVTGVAVASAVGVFLMVVASLTLLPALLGWVGTRIENTTRVALIAIGIMVVAVFIGVTASAAGVVLVGLVLSLVLFVGSFWIGRDSLRRLVPHRRVRPREEQFWYRWSRNIQHRPWLNLGIGAAVLVALALPMFDIRLGFGDYGNQSESQTVRRAYDLMAEGFGPGVNGPIFVSVEGPTATDPDALQAFADDLVARDLEIAEAEGHERGIEFASPRPINENVALVIVIPTAAPQDAEMTSLVNRLRDDIIPGTGVDAMVGGATAGASDFADYLAGRMPILIGVVLLLSFILLMAVFRSLLVPLKAVVMNLLSVGAAYGVLVAVFQWGWLSGIIGVDRNGPIEAWIPMFLFAIVFGLSMDYEVFLLSRMKEEYDKSVRRGKPDNGTAVADGLAITARVITAAALIMFCVFGAFVLGDERALKMFGLGLAMAVLIDATVVRMVLVPSTMELLGDRNWWIPKWLDRILPKIDVEGHHREDAPTPSEETSEEPTSVAP
ncbi:MMPL family transporter [Desertimonas flava]|jgi:RND superfamily putative drug exporter|uniref:MMPL family transporter n=1 Tax=Desertimonas flava TaxID=2064846 RepID=UPI000E357B20|nr:MMPL family transporter [Desertimonas flava]